MYIPQRAKANLHPIENIAESSYEQVVERYGNRLYITAAAELQEKQLYANVPVSILNLYGLLRK